MERMRSERDPETLFNPPTLSSLVTSDREDRKAEGTDLVLMARVDLSQEGEPAHPLCVEKENLVIVRHPSPTI